MTFSVMLHKISSSRISALFFAVLLCFLAVVLALNSWAIYMTNDDATMESIASGVLTGIPNPHLVLTSSIIGYFLAECYKVLPQINWYALYLLAGYCIPFVVLYYRSLSSSSLFNAVFKCSILFILQYLLLLELQFTVASLLMAAAGFLLVYKTRHSKGGFELFIGSVLLCFAFLMRFESIYVLCILGLPLLLYRSYLTKTVRLTFLVIMLLFIGYAVTISDHAIMSKKVGYDLFSFIRATETIIDNPNQINMTDLDEIGWSSTDLNLMRLYFFVDQEIYSPEKVIHLAEGKKGRRTVEMMAMEAASLIKDGYLFILMLLLIIIHLSGSANSDKSAIISFALMNTLVLLLMFILLLSVRLPFHLFLPLLLFPILFAIDNFNFSRNSWSIPICLVLAILTIIECRESFFKRKELAFRLEENLSYMSKWPGLTFQNTNMAVYSNALFGIRNKMYSRPKNLLWFGWIIGTPAYFEHLRLHKLERSHLSGICMRSDILFISDWPIFLELVQAQFKSIEGQACLFKQYDQKGNLRVFKAH
jgi:hypothetical protein